MAFAAFLSLLLWAYHLFPIAGLLRMCEFHHVSPLNISIVSVSAQICHGFTKVTRQTTKEFRRGARVEICGIAQRGSNGVPTGFQRGSGIANIDEEPTLCAARGPQLFNPWALVDPKDLVSRRRH